VELVRTMQGPLPIAMVDIKPGTFRMGSPKDDPSAVSDEGPQHDVQLTRAFQLGKFEVTQAEYEAVMGVNPSLFRAGAFTARYPVEGVSWHDAIEFCNRLSRRQGLKPYYLLKGDMVTILGGNGYRLPTEAEWEYAARAGSTTPWSWG